MFSEIRNRLTLLYTLIMVVLISTFVLVNFAGLIWAIIYELKQEIRLVAQEEVEEQLAIYTLKRSLNLDEREIIHNNVFCYIFDVNGVLVDEEEPDPVLREPVMDKIQSGDTSEGEVDITWDTLPDGEMTVFMMIQQPIIFDSQIVGTAYVGRDITAYFHVLKNVFLALIGGSLVFLLAASVAAHFMAKRAMLPINQSFDRQKQFTADASHELRTPLSVLLASVDAVQTDESSTFSSFSRQVLQDMKDEIHKMSRITTDLLTLARADAGGLEILKEKLDITAVAEPVIRSLQALASEKNIKLEFDGLATPLQIYADRERISQLLLILIDNAIKYTPAHGEVTVRLEKTANGEPKCKITVQDTGIGIPPEYQKMIFERFFRVDKTRSRAAGGTGLGLAIAVWIVKAHNGVIHVRSEVEKGSTFTVLLPALSHSHKHD